MRTPWSWADHAADGGWLTANACSTRCVHQPFLTGVIGSHSHTCMSMWHRCLLFVGWIAAASPLRAEDAPRAERTERHSVRARPRPRSTSRGAKPREQRAAPCLSRPVRIVRAHARPPEARRLALTRCDGSPNLEALDALSVLARPKGVERPSRAAIRRFRRSARPSVRARFVARGIARLHPGLLVRLQAIASRWPGRAIEIVSGYRPRARRTSRHRHARALDLRVAGVPRHRVARFARSLSETGVGYYPRSTFTHVDVRARSVYWVDRAGPGERPDYGPWPPSSEAVASAEGRVRSVVEQFRDELHRAFGDAAELEERLRSAPSVVSGSARRQASAHASSATSPEDAEAGAAALRSDVSETAPPPRPRLEPLPSPERGWEGGIVAVDGAMLAWSSLPP